MYAASEGLSTLVVEREAIGGQAGTSSLIRNYPGFARGISGNHLAFRSFHQAWMFGAVFHFFRSATGLEVDGHEQRVLLSDGTSARTRTTIIATGVDYRRLDLPEVEALIGCGVFYGAAVTEARAMTGHPVVVVGGGNSAGQATLHLAKYASTSRCSCGAGTSPRACPSTSSPECTRRATSRCGTAEVTGARAVDGRLSEVQVTGATTARPPGHRARASSCSSAPRRTRAGSRASSSATTTASSSWARTPRPPAGRMPGRPTPAPANPWRRRHPASSPSVTPAGDRSSGSRPRSVTGDRRRRRAAHLRPGWSCEDRRTGGRCRSVPAIRWLLGFAAVLVFLAGVQLYAFPLDTATRFAWTIASPMTAVFLGASTGRPSGSTSGALARQWSVARVAVPAVFVFTSLTFVVTLLHLDKFHLAGGLATGTRAVAWAWIGVYAVVPVLLALAWVLQARAGTAVPPAAGLPPRCG